MFKQLYLIGAVVCVVFLFGPAVRIFGEPTGVMLAGENRSAVENDAAALLSTEAITQTNDSPGNTIEPSYTNPGNRPVFLRWPLPSTYGPGQIAQYPNTPWTWNFLGLNPGYQCPPISFRLYDPSILPYWRNPAIPEAEDKAKS